LETDPKGNCRGLIERVRKGETWGKKEVEGITCEEKEQHLLAESSHIHPLKSEISQPAKRRERKSLPTDKIA